MGGANFQRNGDISVKRGALKSHTILHGTRFDSNRDSQESHRNISRSLVFKYDKLLLKDVRTVRQEREATEGNLLKTLKLLDNTIRDDKCRTVREIVVILRISESSVHCIISDNSGMRRICARWVHQLLKNEEK